MVPVAGALLSSSPAMRAVISSLVRKTSRLSSPTRRPASSPRAGGTDIMGRGFPMIWPSVATNSRRVNDSGPTASTVRQPSACPSAMARAAKSSTWIGRRPWLPPPKRPNTGMRRNDQAMLLMRMSSPPKRTAGRRMLWGIPVSRSAASRRALPAK